MRWLLIGLIAGVSALAANAAAAADVEQSAAHNAAQTTQTSLGLTDLTNTTTDAPASVDADGRIEEVTGYAGETAVKAANKDLADHGHPGGLEAQGIDSNQITGALKFDGPMPQAAASMTNDVLKSAGLPSLSNLAGMK